MWNWIKKVLFGKKVSMEDPAKVQAKITELNNSTPGQTWAFYGGNFALTSVDFLPGGAQFKPNSGIAIKAFINTTTGEIKIFPYTNFEI